MSYFTLRIILLLMETIKALYISATPTCAAPSGVRAQPLSQTHLTRRSRAALRRFAADNPAHRRIVAQALGVVYVLVAAMLQALLAALVAVRA